MTSAYPIYGTSAPVQVADALADGIATLARCDECDVRFYYHRRRCPRCFSSRVVWDTVTNPFIVRASAIIHRQQNELFSGDGPVLMVAAALDEVTVIAEGHGWGVGDRPVPGSRVAYRVAKRPDATPIPVFVPWDLS